MTPPKIFLFVLSTYGVKKLMIYADSKFVEIGSKKCLEKMLQSKNIVRSAKFDKLQIS
jgi:hypothetical protein